MNYKDLIPGYFQGISRVLVSYPFDYVRLNLQVNKYKNIKSFFKNNSIKNIYRGIQIPLLYVPVERSIQFSLFEKIKVKYNIYQAGVISSFITSIFSLPLSYITNNFVLQKNNNINSFVTTTLKTTSFHKFYNGLTADLIRNNIAGSTYMISYGFLRDYYGNNYLNAGAYGIVSSCIAWTFSYPLETIKIEKQYTNKKFKDIIKNRVNKYGILNLWKGIGIVYLRTAPSAFIGMTVYQYLHNSII